MGIDSACSSALKALIKNWVTLFVIVVTGIFVPHLLFAKGCFNGTCGVEFVLSSTVPEPASLFGHSSLRIIREDGNDFMLQFLGIPSGESTPTESGGLSVVLKALAGNLNRYLVIDYWNKSIDENPFFKKRKLWSYPILMTEGQLRALSMIVGDNPRISPLHDKFNVLTQNCTTSIYFLLFALMRFAASPSLDQAALPYGLRTFLTDSLISIPIAFRYMADIQNQPWKSKVPVSAIVPLYRLCDFADIICYREYAATLKIIYSKRNLNVLKKRVKENLKTSLEISQEHGLHWQWVLKFL